MTSASARRSPAVLGPMSLLLLPLILAAATARDCGKDDVQWSPNKKNAAIGKGCDKLSLKPGYDDDTDPAGDAGATALAEEVKSKKSMIIELDLQHNHIGDAGARALATAIESPQSKIKMLNLWNNEIGDAGGKALATALASPHSKIVELNLRTNHIGEHVMKLINAALKVTREKAGIPHDEM